MAEYAADGAAAAEEAGTYNDGSTSLTRQAHSAAKAAMILAEVQLWVLLL